MSFQLTDYFSRKLLRNDVGFIVYLDIIKLVIASANEAIFKSCVFH
ncbi:hypothetical protein [Tenacibaculum crassostreae]